MSIELIDYCGDAKYPANIPALLTEAAKLHVNLTNVEPIGQGGALEVECSNGFRLVPNHLMNPLLSCTEDNPEYLLRSEDGESGKCLTERTLMYQHAEDE